MRLYIFTLLLLVFVPPALAAEDIYICPMHPHISGKNGDKCPICGMTLVHKIANMPKGDNPETQNAEVLEGTFNIDPYYVHALGVKTDEVTYHEFGKSIRAFGHITLSTRLAHAVDVRAKGWIVDLVKDAVGDNVKKGDLIFTYYSPDLMNAQSDFLLGSRIGNSEQRLRLFGMDGKAITALENYKKFLEKTPFHAPADGIVAILNVRKGAYVHEGGNVMVIQGLSKLWVDVDVPIRDVKFLTVGTPVKVNMPETGEEYDTRIDFIHPVVNPQSRTAVVRLILENPDGVLKPNTYVDAVFDADVQSRLAVPVEAVLYGSIGAYVIENIRDGYFKAVMVKTGITANGLTEITNGLSHGQRIVTSGQFMLDAESNLRGGMDAMGHDHGGMTDIETMQQEGATHGQH